MEGRLNLAVQRAREIAALMQEGALDGLSIGFRTVSAKPGADGSRRLLGIDLWEISVVTFPMQPSARASPDAGPEAIRGLARIVAPARFRAA